MTPLRQRMIEEMQIRNLAAATQEKYIYLVAQFAGHFGKSPELLGPEEIREFQLYLIRERSASPTVLVQLVAALRFLYGTTLRRPWAVESIPYPRKAKKLPTVLSRQEVAKFLGGMRNLKQRAILSLVYGCGLRAAEATHLRIEDIDSKRMLLRVATGKGGKERLVPLSSALLSLFREYWKAYRPSVLVLSWQFAGSTNT